MTRIDPNTTGSLFSIEDARGVVRPSWGMGLGVRDRVEREAMPDEVLARVRRRVVAARSGLIGTDPGAALSVAVMGVRVVVSFIAILVLAAVIAFVAGEPMHVVFVLVLVVGSVVGGYLLLSRRGVRSVWPSLVRDAVLAERRCPACGYDLKGLEHEGDGCVVCPECGAAWRMLRRPCPTCVQELEGVQARKDGLIWCPRCKEACREKGTG